MWMKQRLQNMFAFPFRGFNCSRIVDWLMKIWPKSNVEDRSGASMSVSIGDKKINDRTIFRSHTVTSAAEQMTDPLIY